MDEFGYYINRYMKTHKLMVKTHNKTGLKYLCYTRSEGDTYNSYKGSGTYWKRHLKKYGDNITTILIFESEDFDEFKREAIKFSIEFDIVNSSTWANLKIEEGDGGDTVSNKRWITDGNIDKYINKDDILPEGWNYGRSNCIFNDPSNQQKFSLMSDNQKRSTTMLNVWKDGKMDKRDNSRCGIKGDLNPSKRQDVRSKISKAISQKIFVKGKNFNSKKEAKEYFNVCYNTINKWLKDGC